MLTGRVMRLQRVAGLRASPGPHLVPALPFSAACRTRDVKAHQQPARSAGVLPSDANQSPFAELDILEITDGLGRTRVRQHVNPLSRQHQVVAGPLPWHEVFSEPTAPLVVDLGCGPGRFLLLLHHRRRGPQQPTTNYLGLEIRKPLVERANEWVPRLGFQGAVHYCTCNATISLGTMLSSYPGRVQLVCIQFPDPHFKRRHYKRRIFQPQMVRDVAQLLAPGGQLFLQSDVLEVAVAMRNMVEKYVGDCFELSPLHHEPGAVFWQEPEPAQLQQPTQHQEDAEATSTSEDSEEDAAVGPGAGLPEAGDDGSEDDDYLTLQSVWAQAGWLSANPLGVPTEREHYVQQQGLPVYRILLARKQT